MFWLWTAHQHQYRSWFFSSNRVCWNIRLYTYPCIYVISSTYPSHLQIYLHWCSGQNLTSSRITTRVLQQDHKPTLWNPIRSFRHSPFEDFQRLWLQSHTVSRRHSDSNPRVPPHDSNSFHPKANHDEISQIAKAVKRLYPLTRSRLYNGPITYQTVGDNDG